MLEQDESSCSDTEETMQWIAESKIKMLFYFGFLVQYIKLMTLPVVGKWCSVLQSYKCNCQEFNHVKLKRVVRK